jgi:hypothetical protein
LIFTVAAILNYVATVADCCRLLLSVAYHLSLLAFIYYSLLVYYKFVAGVADVAALFAPKFVLKI